jgi:hypothetical protein
MRQITKILGKIMNFIDKLMKIKQLKLYRKTHKNKILFYPLLKGEFYRNSILQKVL